jgi:3-hydroxy-9,10-secoandrosta-1,3,5(10)-triene-9,17-dione monooxygenase reductase component
VNQDLRETPWVGELSRGFHNVSCRPEFDVTAVSWRIMAAYCAHRMRVEPDVNGPQHGDFRTVLGHFATGVAIVTSTDEKGPLGMTVQSFCSLSLDPALILLCPGRTSTTWPRLEARQRMCVNLLAENQEELARQFARTGTDKFEGVEWSPSAITTSPVLEGCLAWIDCELNMVHPGGDHLVAICSVLDLRARSDLRPLIFFKSGFERML